MFEILALIVVSLGVAALARGRGAAQPWLFGAATAAAWVAGSVLARPFGAESVARLLLPWLGVGIVASVTRFVLGAGKPKPDAIWSCPDCHMVNESSYVVCQACSRPWSPA